MPEMEQLAAIRREFEELHFTVKFTAGTLFNRLFDLLGDIIGRLDQIEGK